MSSNEKLKENQTEKNNNNDQDQNIEEDQLDYLSSENLMSYEENEKNKMKKTIEREQVIERTNSQKIKNIFFIIIVFVLKCIIFIFFPIYILYCGLKKYKEQIREQIKKKGKVPFTVFLQFSWTYTCCVFVLVCIYNVIRYTQENITVRYFKYDCLIFYFSLILVFTYLEMNYSKQTDSFKKTIQNMFNPRSCSTFQYYSGFQNDNMFAYFLDFDIFEQNQNQAEPININQVCPQQIKLDQSNQDDQEKQTKQIDLDYAIKIKQQEYSEISQKFSTFLDDQSKINNPMKSINEFYKEFNKYIEYSKTSFYFLLVIIFFKIGFCSYYIYYRKISVTENEEFSGLFYFIFLYTYYTFNLNRILGNNDLRRKHAFMIKQSAYMDFRNIKEINLQDRLDVTCPISLQTWDNARKFMLNYQKEWLQNLEWSYAFLFLYYILVTLVSLSSYFELYWIFSKDSVLLLPIMVIMSTFNFIFLSGFFLIRFYEGDKFNDTFEDLDDNLVYLIDIIEDLLTIFDVHFNNKEKKQTEDEQSIYEIIITKIKYKSAYYIEKQLEFENKIYKNTKEDKTKLRKKLLQNAKSSLKNVKKSLNHDSNKHKYKFLNVVEFRFKETLFTLIVTTLTVLPTIIPKFKEFFQDDTQ